jgi:hypothetical protein
MHLAGGWVALASARSLLGALVHTPALPNRPWPLPEFGDAGRSVGYRCGGMRRWAAKP